MKSTAVNLIFRALSSGRKSRQLGTLLALGLFALPLANVQGATFTWASTATSGPGTLWADGANWVGGVAPSFDGTEDIILPGTSRLQELGGLRDMRTLTVQADGPWFSGASGAIIKLESGMTISGPATTNVYMDSGLKLGADNVWNFAANNNLRPRVIDFGSFTLTKTGLGRVYNNWGTTGTGSLNLQGGEWYNQKNNTSSITSLTIGGGSTYHLDNSTAGGGSFANRLNDAMPITMAKGTLDMIASSTAATIETMGALTISSGGEARVTINPSGSSFGTGMTFSSLTRNTGSTVAFQASGITLGEPNPITFTSAPTLSNGLLAGGVAYAADSYPQLAGYDATNGVIVATYQSTTIAAAAATDNVNIVLDETLLADATINALRIFTTYNASNNEYGHGLDLGGKTLTVASGMVVMSRNSDCIDNGTLAFGTAEGIFYGYSQDRISQNANLTITGSAGVTFAGDLFWGGRANWTGPTTITGGCYILANAWDTSRDLFPNSSALTIGSGGTLQMAGAVTKTETIGSLAGAGRINIVNDATHAYTLAAGSDNTSTTFLGIMDGKFSFTKQGSGTFTFTGTGNNTGNVTVSAGTLTVNGTLSSTATIVMASGTLDGTGTIIGDTSILGTYGSRVDSSGTPSTEMITVTGAVDVDGATLALSDKAVSPVVLPAGVPLTILSCTGALTGEFGEGMTEGATVTVGPNDYVIHYLPSSVTLTSVVTATNSYTTWATEMLIPGELATVDHDLDGLTNGMEYALGLVPTVPDGAPGSVTGNLLSFTKGTAAIANGDVTYIIEESDDLGITDAWTPVVTQSPPNADLTIEHTLPSGRAKVFARLRTLIP